MKKSSGNIKNEDSNFQKPNDLPSTKDTNKPIDAAESIKEESSSNSNTNIAHTSLRQVKIKDKDLSSFTLLENQTLEEKEELKDETSTFQREIEVIESLQVNQKSKRGRKILLIALIVILLLVGVGAGAWKFQLLDFVKPVEVVDPNKITPEKMIKELEAEIFYPGTIVENIDISGLTKEEAKLKLEQTQPEWAETIDLTLEFEEQKFTVDQAYFSFRTDTDTVLDQAWKDDRKDYTKTKSDIVEINQAKTEKKDKAEKEALKEKEEQLSLEMEAEYQKIYTDRKNQPKKYTLNYTVDETVLEAKLRRLLENVNLEPVNAELGEFDLEQLTFTITPEVEGQVIDFPKVSKDVIALIEAGTYDSSLKLQTQSLPPEITQAFLEEAVGLISTTTTNTTKNADRNTNIDLIAKSINGLVIPPEGTFDFNSHVGQRTAEKGYRPAAEIFDGSTRLQYGGGICQPNTTLFHSVVKADLQVDTRFNHTFPVDYVNPGTDATVSWGGPEFKFTNNTGYPIALHAYFKDFKVTVEIYGKKLEDNMEIKFVGEIVSSGGAGAPEYIADPSMAVGQRQSDRSPHNYISAVSYKIWMKDGVEVRREKAFSTTYPAIRARIKVGTRGPDGAVYPMDPGGNVAVPEAPPPTDTVPPVTEPGDIVPTNPGETTPPPPTDTAPPAETPAPTPPAETPPPTTTQDPTLPVG